MGDTSRFPPDLWSRVIIGTPFLGIGVFGCKDAWGPCSPTFIGIKAMNEDTGSGGSSTGGGGISAWPKPPGVIGVDDIVAPGIVPEVIGMLGSQPLVWELEMAEETAPLATPTCSRAGSARSR